MNKKPIILLGMMIILLSLSIYFIFSNNSENVDVTLANVEALATSEDSDKLEVTCVDSGTICIGIDGTGAVGRHPGLTKKTKL